MMANVRRECVSGINEGTLRAFLDGELDIDRLRMLQEHTRSCAACAERLSQLKMDGALVHSRLALLDAEVAPAGVGGESGGVGVGGEGGEGGGGGIGKGEGEKGRVTQRGRWR